MIGQGKIAISGLYMDIPPKWWDIQPGVLLVSNRKSHAPFSFYQNL